MKGFIKVNRKNLEENVVIVNVKHINYFEEHIIHTTKGNFQVKESLQQIADLITNAQAKY